VKCSPAGDEVWDVKKISSREKQHRGIPRNASRSIRELEEEILKVDNDLVGLPDNEGDDYPNAADFEKEFTSKFSKKSSCIDHDFLLE